MNPLNAIKKLIKKETTLAVNSNSQRSIGGSSIFATYKTNDYENAYPAINRLANSVLMVEPYTIDKNGKPVESNILDRIYTPNTEMSAQDFREALAIMSLVHPKVNLQVHYKGSRLTADSITGFTFIESEGYIQNDKWYFRLPNGDIISSDEVITLKSINPYKIQDGFTPTQSAQRWIRIDDYIAEYQAGFFKNGAIPSGQFIVTAKTRTEFNDIVDRLEENHKGAGKNNNVSYVHRPTDSNGKAQEADVEWIPFNVQNKEMALKDLFEQANKKIDSAYGVPASIRGVNDNNTYASVRVDEVIFNKYVVDPLLLKLWGKFTHELNRVTGGTGVAITYDLDIPTVADEEKIKAESDKIKVETMLLLEDRGYTRETIINALDLPQTFSELKTQSKDVSIQIDDIKDKVTAVGTLIRSGFNAEESLQALGLPKIEHLGLLPVTLASTEVVSQTPEEINNNKQVHSKQLDPVLKTQYEDRVKAVAQNYLQQQVKEAIDKFDSKDISPNQLADDFMSVLVPLVTLEGTIQRQAGIQLLLQAGLDASGTSQFTLSPEQLKAYKTYLNKVATSYTESNAEGIRNILKRGAEQQLNQAQIRTQLREFANEKWRAERIARTEVNRAGSTASVNAMENISRETGYEIVKVWNVNADACEFCQEFQGKTEAVDKPFLELGDEVVTPNGATLKNEFIDVEDATLHPHCACFTTYEVVR